LTTYNSISNLNNLKMPLRLSLFASLMDCCNAKRDGKCFRYRKDWKTQGLNSLDLRRNFSQRAKLVLDDIEKVKFSAKKIKVIHGDARLKLETLSPRSFDLMVTSPPYLNSFDYSDVYRPELFVGGFVKNNDELRNIRLQTIRSHVQANWKSSKEICSPILEPLISKLNKKMLWNNRLPDMITSYFADMSKILKDSYRLIRRKGHAWIVVSTSAYGGIEIPVDLILADIGTRNGWNLIGVNVLRQMRTAGQQKLKLKTTKNLPLRESLIILQKP
jgi:DNA modification methylase